MIFSNFNRLVITSRYFIIPALAVFLSGCVGMGSKFDCNVDSGGRCAPMHHINQMANYGAFTDIPEKPYKLDKLLLAGSKARATKQQVYETMPIRSNEQVQQIWIAPYEDNNGNYHEGSNIHVVTKKGNWVYPPNK